MSKKYFLTLLKATTNIFSDCWNQGKYFQTVETKLQYFSNIFKIGEGKGQYFLKLLKTRTNIFSDCWKQGKYFLKLLKPSSNFFSNIFSDWWRQGPIFFSDCWNQGSLFSQTVGTKYQYFLKRLNPRTKISSDCWIQGSIFSQTVRTKDQYFLRLLNPRTNFFSDCWNQEWTFFLPYFFLIRSLSFPYLFHINIILDCWIQGSMFSLTVETKDQYFLRLLNPGINIFSTVRTKDQYFLRLLKPKTHIFLVLSFSVPFSILIYSLSFTYPFNILSIPKFSQTVESKDQYFLRLLNPRINIFSDCWNREGHQDSWMSFASNALIRNKEYLALLAPSLPKPCKLKGTVSEISSDPLC